MTTTPRLYTFLLNYTYCNDALIKREPFREGHIALSNEYRKKGKLFRILLTLKFAYRLSLSVYYTGFIRAGGAYSDVSGAAFLFEFKFNANADQDEKELSVQLKSEQQKAITIIQEFRTRDPYVTNGIVIDSQIKQWDARWTNSKL